ncbi:hypothetical protein CDIK_3065 [Cucumispora dikerogammari]|nr:hypothetical protein CDIK_3065 [Cucumispora dikerogammari]
MLKRVCLTMAKLYGDKSKNQNTLSCIKKTVGLKKMTEILLNLVFVFEKTVIENFENIIKTTAQDNTMIISNNLSNISKRHTFEKTPKKTSSVFFHFTLVL